MLDIGNFELLVGEKILIVGANGSGKSTLLRLIAGISTVSEGRVERSKELRTMRIGFVPQSGGLYEDLTLWQNFEVFRRLYGMEPDYSLSNTWLGECGSLDTVKNIPVGQMSGGIKQLATIACVLSFRPDSLLLDEPASDLDVVHRKQLSKLLADLAPALAFLLISAHDTHGFDFFDRKISMSDGRFK